MAIMFVAGKNTGLSFGGGPVWFVGQHLSARQRDFGPALQTIEIDLWYHWPELSFKERRRGFADVFEQRPAELAKLPKRVFKRKRQSLRVEWDTGESREGVEGVYLPQMTPDQFDRALDVLIAALRYGLKAVKRTDEVDSEGLLAWVASVRREHRGDATSLREVLEADRAFMNRLRLQRLQETDPWDLLDIDWARYPVAAREVLDDPSDWSLGDDFSPHGNDTGADIFADWSRYRRDRPLQAVHRLFGEPYISKPPEPSDKDRWWVWVEIHLALAFGHIKMAGACPADLAGMTLEVLARERGAAEARADWPRRDDWLGRLERFERILARFAE